MARGTFANIRLVNKFMQKAGPKTIHVPSGMSRIIFPIIVHLCFFLCLIGEIMDVFDAAERYRNEGRALIILAGRDYGSGECGIYNNISHI